MPFESRVSNGIDQVLLHPPEGGLTNTSVTLPDQIRAVDRSRLVKRLGRIPDRKLTHLNRTLKVVLSLR